MTFRITQVLAALAVFGIVAVTATPALACEKPVKKAAPVVAAPVAEKPERHESTPAAPVNHPAPAQVAAPVAPAPTAPPVKPTPAATQPVVNHPLDSATVPPVKKVDAGQPVSTPSPASTPAPVQGKTSQAPAPQQPQIAAPAPASKAPDKPVYEIDSYNSAKPVPGTPCAQGAVRTTSFAGNVGGTANVGFTVADTCQKTELSLTSYSLQHPYYRENEAQASYDSRTGTYGPGSYNMSVHVPNCDAQIDLAYGPGFIGSSVYPAYGNRGIRGQILEGGPCSSTTPYQPPPPVEKPPVKQIDCGKDTHLVGEKCIPNAQPPVSKPPVVVPPVAQNPQVTVPVSQPPQAQQPRLIANHAPATVQATPITRTPLAPNTGREALPNELAATGSNEIIHVVFAVMLLMVGAGAAMYCRRDLKRNPVRAEEDDA